MVNEEVKAAIKGFWGSVPSISAEKIDERAGELSQYFASVEELAASVTSSPALHLIGGGDWLNYDVDNQELLFIRRGRNSDATRPLSVVQLDQEQFVDSFRRQMAIKGLYESSDRRLRIDLRAEARDGSSRFWIRLDCALFGIASVQKMWGFYLSMAIARPPDSD